MIQREDGVTARWIDRGWLPWWLTFSYWTGKPLPPGVGHGHTKA